MQESREPLVSALRWRLVCIDGLRLGDAIFYGATLLEALITWSVPSKHHNSIMSVENYGPNLGLSVPWWIRRNLNTVKDLSRIWLNALESECHNLALNLEHLHWALSLCFPAGLVFSIGNGQSPFDCLCVWTARVTGLKARNAQGTLG